MAPQPRSPFRPAEQVSPKVKALVFGPPGVGKTFLALTSPGPIAVVDTEGGTAFYAKRIGRGGLSSFDVLPTKTYRDVQEAVGYLAANPTAYATLVIDPVTVIYETLQEAAQIKRADRRHDPEADLAMLDWQRIKRAYKALMTELVNLPLHVIVTAREKDEVIRKGNDTEKIGVKPDAEKATSYYFDTVLHMIPSGPNGRAAVVLKDRTGSHELNARVEAPSFASLFGTALGVAGNAGRAIPSDDEAARRDAQTTLSSPWSATRVKQAAGEAGVERQALLDVVNAVSAGRPSSALAEADWRQVAIRLGMETGAVDEPAVVPEPVVEPVQVAPQAPEPVVVVSEPTVASEAAERVAVKRAERVAEQREEPMAEPCGVPSPYGDSTVCIKASGHDGLHANGERESWAQ